MSRRGYCEACNNLRYGVKSRLNVAHTCGRTAEENLLSYIRGLNPQPEEQTILIYGSKYKVWRNSVYMGIAEWRKDENVGDSFQVDMLDGQNRKVINVVTPDYWELIIEKK